jgi:pilus assembly protein FimV
LLRRCFVSLTRNTVEGVDAARPLFRVGRLTAAATTHVRRAPAVRVALALLSVVGSNFATHPVHALALGSERVASFYGQPLRVEIQINAASGEQWDASCFKLVTPSRRDGTVNLRQGQIEVSPDGQRLIIRSPIAVEELAVRFAVDVGCEVPLRREYTVLLDPAPITPPSATGNPVTQANVATAAATAAASGNAASPATVTNDPARAQGDETRQRARSRRSQDAAPTRPRGKDGASTPPQSNRAARNTRSNESRLVLKGSDRVAIDDASLAALAVPRLRISGDLPAWAANDMGVPSASPAPGAPVDELAAAIAKEKRARLAAAPIEEDLPLRLEADLVVAKKRLAELQLQLSAASPKETGASTISEPASSTAKKTPDAQSNGVMKAGATFGSTFDWRTWAWIPALAVIAGLLAFLWRQFSAQRRNSTWTEVETATVVRVDQSASQQTLDKRSEDLHFDGAALGNPPTVSEHTTSSATIVEASKRLENPLFHPNQTASSVDVSVLSHVTDEAQVYADLGRANEAIEILAHHIDTSEADRPSPAPWLMLFELFRKSNRREDYDRLAPMFRKKFNGRLPEWDSYGDELALGDGLESFPHLIARIERDWGTVNARVFLDELLYDNRGGSRLGFSLAAYKDLLLLVQLHDQMAHDGTLEKARTVESPGANDNDGTPKWDISLDMIEPPKPGELDEFLAARKPGER